MGLFNFRSKKPGDGDAPVAEPSASAAAAPPAEPAAETPKQGFLARMRAKLNRGNSWLTYDLANLLPGGKIDDSVLDELETRLIAADVGIETTEKILASLRGRVQRKELGDLDALIAALRTCHAGDPAAGRAAARDRCGEEAVRDPGRRRQRFGQDHDHRQARASLHGRGSQGGARRRRHLPRGGDRAAAGLGRAQRRARDRAGGRRRPGRRHLRRAAVGRRRAASTC